MFIASSAAVAPPAMVRLLIIICCGQLMVTTLKTVEASDMEETQCPQIIPINTGCYFAGSIYLPGSIILEACAQLQCNGNTGRFDFLGHDEELCSRCWVWGDPHILPYDQSKDFYSYQRCGNYSLTQIGNFYTSPYAVYATFRHCTDRYPHKTCVESVTFKNDHHTFITVGYANSKFKIQLNGNDINPVTLANSPSIITDGNIYYPLLAWKIIGLECVVLQGSSGLTVKFCNLPDTTNKIFVWATPDILPGLRGLCGLANGNTNDDLTARDGITSLPVMTTDQDSVDIIVESWISVEYDYADICVNRRIELKNNCEANTSLTGIFQSQCEDAVMNGVFTDETNESQTLIGSCVYDLCAALDPVKGLESMHAAMKVHTHIKNNTVGHCKHKRTHKCKTHNGTCILKTETCDGTIIDGGCHGTKCDCCAPSGCVQSSKCLQKEGKCLLLKDAMSCDGIVNSELCSGNNCACCYPGTTCKMSKRCSKRRGKCMAIDTIICDGKISSKLCSGKGCACCLPGIPETTCRKGKKCSKKRGKCIKNNTNCIGKIFNKWCPDEDCACCISKRN